MLINWFKKILLLVLLIIVLAGATGALSWFWVVLTAVLAMGVMYFLFR